MAKKITLVLSQGQSAQPAKRRLEEDLVAAMLFERGIEVTVIPHLYDLTPDGSGMLCLQGISGDMIVLSWLFPRAAHWILDRNGIRGRVGVTALASEETPDDELDEELDGAGDDELTKTDEKNRVEDSRPASNRVIHCIDLRVRDQIEPYVTEIRRIVREATTQTFDLGGWVTPAALAPAPAVSKEAPTPPGVSNGHAAPVTPMVNGLAAASGSLGASGVLEIASIPPEGAGPVRVVEEAPRRWYPVIDYSRCTNCMECIDFCLFGVYGVDRAETILVEQPDNCRKGCPACSRVCPENAIIFPQHKTPAIAGSADGEAGGLKIDLSKLFGAPDALEVAVLERDVELVATGRDAVGKSVGIPARQLGKRTSPKDELDSLMDQLDDLAL